MSIEPTKADAEGFISTLRHKGVNPRIVGASDTAAAAVPVVERVRLALEVYEVTRRLAGVKLGKRPVAFLAPAKDGTDLVTGDEALAAEYAARYGRDYQGLYVRDGDAQ